MNSLGKDSVACLEWLAHFAYPSHIVSVYYEFFAKHPGDDPYFAYLKRRYPHVEFITRPNSIEINQIQAGIYQSPLDVNHVYNHFEYEDFSRRKQTEEIMAEYQCDYIASGFSKYEGFARASRFYQEGLVTGHHIYPLGLMEKRHIYNIVASMKLHPSYKFSKSTFDQPTWYKMRSACIANPEYEKILFKWFPLLRLDKYRWEKLIHGQTHR